MELRSDPIRFQMKVNYMNLNNFVFEMYNREVPLESSLPKPDFILRSKKKKIDVFISKEGFNFISIKCVKRIGLNFHFLRLHVENMVILGMTSLNINNVDDKTIQVFFYVIGNMKEDLLLDLHNYKKTGLHIFYPVD